MSMSKTPVPRAAGRTHANGAAHDKNRELSPIESDQLRQKVYADDDAVRKGIADLILLGMSGCSVSLRPLPCGGKTSTSTPAGPRSPSSAPSSP